MPRKEHKEYYAVIEGIYLAKPTIYSSWAKTHLRVTGHKKQRERFFKGFHTLEKAEDFMLEEGIGDYILDIASTTEDTRPRKGAHAYYAVAYGRHPGIYRYYNSDDGTRLCVGGARLQVDNVSGNCHKHFRTEAQADTFIKEWTNLYLEMVMSLYETQLTQGWRPPSTQGSPVHTNLLQPPLSQRDSEIEIISLIESMGSATLETE